MPGLRASLSRLTGLRQRLRTLGHANLRQGAPAGFGFLYVKQNDGSFAPLQVQTASGFKPFQLKVS